MTSFLMNFCQSFSFTLFFLILCNNCWSITLKFNTITSILYCVVISFICRIYYNLTSIVHYVIKFFIEIFLCLIRIFCSFYMTGSLRFDFIKICSINSIWPIKYFFIFFIFFTFEIQNRF